MLKKLMIFTAFGLVVLVALGVAGYAYAQSQTPTPGQPWGGMMGGRGAGMMGGRGMMGNYNQSGQPSQPGQPGYGRGRGMMGGGMMGNGSFGPIHTYMINALAPKLNLTPEALQARIDQGETPYQIAQSLGKTDAEIQALMEAAHDEALQAAVAAGVITQQQADWMDQHMAQMGQNGGGPGGCMGGRYGAPATTPAPTTPIQ